MNRIDIPLRATRDCHGHCAGYGTGYVESIESAGHGSGVRRRRACELRP